MGIADDEDDEDGHDDGDSDGDGDGHDDGDGGGDGDDHDDGDDNYGGGGPGGGRTCSWLFAKKGCGALGGRAGLYGWPCG